ncbi:transglycosylase domain-containing protein [Rhodobaculum claviforme]|uniref:peptidoglycan glycosyltransferase n=1 Tax=Rhodobaculum claviforme TaxID=1549854 RepID=A0A934TNU5_9RHOB|nr:transglycosylase domain-containing protein [Rhodobaculum claviforme]MBK5928488.1 glycosyl transferase [Rhodobaculum claviforme]
MAGPRSRPPLVADRRATPPRKPTKPPRKPAQRRPARPRRGGLLSLPGRALRFVLRVLWGLAWRMTAVVALLLAAATFYFYTTLPGFTDLLDGRARGSVTMLDADGQVFAWRGETFGGQITAQNISPHLRHAILATEDRRFERHFGVSPRGILGAMRINIAAGRNPLSGHGGSTITQQVAKLLCLGRPFDPAEFASEAEFERDCRRSTVWRKLQELPYAFALEAKFTKDEILSIYMNRAYLGAGTRGFEAAAQRFFGVSANEVDPAQSAMLAGLLVAPSTFAPTRNLARAQGRANLILGLMEEEGYLTAEQVAEYRANPAQLSEAAGQRAGGAFADWMMDAGPDFLTRDTTEDVILTTTLDARIQRAAEDAVTRIFAERVREGSTAQAAVVVMSADGAVRAMVGGRDNRIGAFNRATQALRQTGSAFKPFVFAVAMEMGYEPSDIVEDAPLTLTIPGSGPWSPRNYTNEFRGLVTLTEAFAHSLNIPAVRITEAMGRDNVRSVANGFGLRSSLAEGPALALGASESTLLDMTAAYAGILAGGRSVRPYGMTEVRLQGDSEALMTFGTGVGDPVISEAAARRLTWMMEKVVSTGTGRRAALPGGREVAGKTGTTQGARDAWFIGFTADYVAGVWMGYDDNSRLTGVTGGGLPAEIWREVMVAVHEGVPMSPLPMDPPLTPPPAFDAPTTPERPWENPDLPVPEGVRSDGWTESPVAPWPGQQGGPSGSASGFDDIGSAIERALRDTLGTY